MKINKNRLFLELALIGAFFLAITSNVAAIQPNQATYDNNAVWKTGTVLNYTYSYLNNVGPGDAYYNPTVEITADVGYEVTEVAGNIVNITETIDNIIIRYNHPFELTSPFVGLYNETATMDEFLRDMINETYGDSTTLDDDFYILQYNTSSNVPITNNLIFKDIGPFTNNMSYNKLNNSVTPLGEVINRFIVSSDIQGSGINYSGSGIDYTNVDKVTRFGVFYTPMAFSGQDGTIWLDMRMGDMVEVENYGLWADYGSGYSMEFRENETYTFDYGHDDQGEILRWASKFEIGYPKVGTNEKVKIDSETGLIYEYESEPVRLGYKVDEDDLNSDYYGNIKPVKIRFFLTDSNLSFQSNATPEIPGYPLLMVLISLGIGFALVYKRYKKNR